MKRLIKANELDNYIQKLCDTWEYDDNEIDLLEEIGKSYGIEVVKFFATLDDINQIKDYYEKLKDGLSLDQIIKIKKIYDEIIANNNFDEDQLKVIVWSLNSNLSKDKIDIIINSGDYDRMEQIFNLFEADVDENIVKKIAESDLNWMDIKYIENSLDLNDLSNKEIDYLVNANSYDELYLIINVLEEGLSIEYVKIYLDNFDSDQNRRYNIIKWMKAGMSVDSIKKFLSFNLMTANFSRYFNKFISEHSLSDINEFINILDNLNDDQRGVMKLLLRDDKQLKDIKNFAEIIKSYNNLDINQLTAVYRGFCDDLSLDQIAIYAKDDIDYGQMQWMEMMLSDYKDKEDLIKLIANFKFTYNQLFSLNDAFKSNLDDDIIKYLINPNIDDDIMDEIISNVKHKHKTLKEIKEEYGY